MNYVTNNQEALAESLIKKYDAIEALYPNIYERKANMSIAGVNARTYNHWRNEGLVGEIPIKGEQRLWVKMNIYDFVWLKIVKTLREFGIPIETIKELKMDMDSNILEKISGELESYFEFLSNETKMSPQEIKQHKEEIELGIKYKDEISAEEKHLTSMLGGLIHSILLMKDDVSVVVFKNGETFEFGSFSFQTIEAFSKQISNWISIPHINIPLKSFVQEFVEEPKNDSHLEFWGFINKNERKVLDALRNKDFKEIVIKKQNNSDGLIIEASMDGTILNQKAKEIRRILGLNEYSEITIKYRNDKNLYFKNKARL